MGAPLFQTIQTSNQTLNQIQAYITSALNSLVGPFLGGQLIQNVSVSTAGTTINTGLGRVPQIWTLCDQQTDAVIWRISWNTNSITLKSSADCIVSLWVN